MTHNNEHLRQTAYRYDAQPSIEDASRTSGWGEHIDTLLRQGYRFLDATYDPGGALFRGMSSGAATAIHAGKFGYFSDSTPQCALETHLGVLFCSQDLSDAVTVSRIWEASDSAVLVFSSDVFVRQWAVRQAAVMAFAEAGIIFRYPFVLQPLALSDLAIAVRPHGACVAPASCKQIELPSHTAGDRNACLREIEEITRSNNLIAASVRYGVEYPLFT